MFKDKTVLITGGTGTWGQELARQALLNSAEKIIIFSRNESAQVAMKQQFNSPRLRFVIGDIRDAGAIKEACQGVNIVFHTAALKHVNKCEEQRREAVKSNIYGTQNVIDACIDNNVDRCVYISTDKVCDANCFYGKTKAIAEDLIIEANNMTLHTDFFCVRSGNILASSGSVVSLWIRQLADNNIINLTHKNMRRFFITIVSAVEKTFKAMRISDKGEIFVFSMQPFYLIDLAKIIIKRYGNTDSAINITSPAPGERLTEPLLTKDEISRTIVINNFYVIYPLIKIKTTNFPVKVKTKLKKGFCMDDFAAPDNRILEKMLEQSGY